MTTSVTLDAERLQALEDAFSGRLLQPGDGGYDEARKIHNGLIDKRPALIARCRKATDVAAAIAFAREAGLEISVRGGGHNAAGRAVTDGGVMVDLAEMKEIQVDPEERTLRAEPGVLWKELNTAAGEHGLAVTGGAISTTGIAGLTLGGGLGWLMGVHGLAADNLVSVELVTADGEILDVAAETHPDLFWALRGGGGNFGVATSFEYRLHPVAQVVGGIVAHPFEAAADLLRFYREFSATTTDELSVFAALAHAPDGSGAKVAAFAICHVGSPEQAERDLAPLKEFGSPLMTEVGPMPYPVMNTILDDAYPTGALYYWKSSFVKSLDDGLIDAIVEQFASTPSPMNAMLFEHFHGAVTRVPIEATAVPHREPGYNFVLTTTWLDAADSEANVTWTQETFEAARPYFAPRRWLNYLGDDEKPDAIRAAYGPNYDRLVEIKRRYDPENVFHLNHNVDPAG
jgi:FAD/FMN-containing dehydrogenase